MSRSESAAELSMEDILASIRSLVPADQRGEDGDGRGPGLPPIPPTLNRVERAPPPPPTPPLGALTPSRADGAFEDDLADLLDDPAPQPPRPAGFDASPALEAPVPPPPPAAFTPAPKPSVPLPPVMTGRAGLDLDALFARPAPQPEAQDAPANAAPPLPSVWAENAREVPVADSLEAAPVPPPSAPPLMGLGQNSGFIPPPFGKRPAPPPPPVPAEPVSTGAAEPSSEAKPQPPSPTIPPLRRSTFFPASYQPMAAPAPEPQPVAEAQTPRAVTAADQADVSVRAEVSSAPPIAPPVPPAAADEERVSYSDALDQALKRLQGLGSLLPEPVSLPAAATAPKTKLEAFAFEPRAYDAPRPSPVEETVAPEALAVPSPAPQVALPVESQTAAPAAAEVLATRGALSPDEEPVALVEAAPAAEAPAEVQAPIEVTAEDVPPPPAPQQPTVRLSDTLWSKSAPSQASEAPLSADPVIPETVDLLDVPRASPVAQAFGALALGLAGGGSAAIGTSTTASAAPSAPAAPLIAAEQPAPLPPAPEPPRPEASAVALRPAEDPLAFASQEVAPRMPEAQAQPAPSPPAAGTPRTLEDMVADMLRPMLKHWLEANMPRIVEKALRAETSERQRD